VSAEVAPIPGRSRSGASRIAVLALSIGVLAGVPLWWGLSRPAANIGTVPSGLGQPDSTGPVRFDPTAPSLGTIQIHSARLRDQRLQGVPRPVSLSIPAIGVDAIVIPVGIDQPTGSIQIPTDIRIVGWYRYGPAPGLPGSTLLVGHVDSNAQGAGVFFRLRQLNLGAIVSVRTAGGSVAAYRVVARRFYPKAALPARIFSASGSPTLTLITCGGAFDPVTRHYEDNVVIYAIPAHG
jgi:hypothetical protein